MSFYRRAQTTGGTYFFTVVTYHRRPLLIQPESRRILHETINQVRKAYPFDIDAWVLLPEHLHCVWTLPPSDADFSTRWGLIKAGFTKQARELFHKEEWINLSKEKHREGTIWQRRFWEHEIRDDKDFHNHINYVHYNPVKHGLVRRVRDWPYSTFHRYVRTDVYPVDWGDNVTFENDEMFGE